MNENLFQAQYDLSKKSKLKNFYEKNKTLIFSAVLILIITIALITFYSESKDKKKLTLAENYIKAKVYIDKDNRKEAKDILQTIILANDSTYSTLSLFLVLNKNLITDKNELSVLFNHILKNNKFEKEIKNLIIFKKALFQSDFVNELELLEELKPLINTESVWKPHALLLLGDYFAFNKEYLKAKEFYIQILSLKNLNTEMYEQARSQLALISNE